ncbi:MAG: DUF899 domain-containing protein [Burkholderiaceae bacterium]
MKSIDLTDRQTWLAARKSLLAEEKSLTQARERLAQARRALPAVLVDQTYEFETERGRETLLQLFKGKRQLVIYHFMFGDDWAQGCPSCSFWADNYDGAITHLAARDTSLVAVSSARLSKLLTYRSRMAWSFDWVSSAGSEFNADYGVTFNTDEVNSTGNYNYANRAVHQELPGISVFVLLNDDKVAHTYSTYARGLDMVNGTYQLLDLTPLGRDEADLPYAQSWVRRHDQYD